MSGASFVSSPLQTLRSYAKKYWYGQSPEVGLGEGNSTGARHSYSLKGILQRQEKGEYYHVKVSHFVRLWSPGLVTSAFIQ